MNGVLFDHEEPLTVPYATWSISSDGVPTKGSTRYVQLGHCYLYELLILIHLLPSS